MNEAFDPRELARLASAALDGVVADDELARLESILAANPVARAFYYRIADLHADLAWKLGGDLRGASGGPSHLPAIASASPACGAKRSPVLGFLSAVSHRISGGEFVVGSLVVLVIAAAFWGLANAYYVKLVADPSHPAYIAASNNALWHNQPQASPPAASAANQPSIVEGEPLELASGVVELKLKQGVKLVIEGPAAWTIDGENRATIERGKLLASVPRQAIGFTVETPQARIVDLGTEFGVVVDRTGRTEVHVLRGEVESRQLSSEHGRSFPPVRLSAGDALKIDGQASGIVRMAAEPGRFVASARLAAAAPAVVPAPRSYREAVLADMPIAYWPLQEKEGATSVEDLSGNGHDGTVHGGLRLGFVGPFDGQSAARFYGNSWIEIATPDQLAMMHEFTVEVWLRPDSMNDVGRVLSVDPRTALSHGWGFGWLPGHPKERPNDGIFFSLYAVKDHELVPREWPAGNRWHHVLIVCDRSFDAHLFLDGRWTAMVEGEKPAIAGVVQAAIGRQTNGTQAYRGDLAHLAVYPYALVESQIRRHFEFAQQADIAAPKTEKPVPKPDRNPKAKV